MMRLIFKTSSVTPDFFYVFNLILSFSTCSESFEKICTWELLGANVLKSIRYKLNKEGKFLKKLVLLRWGSITRYCSNEGLTLETSASESLYGGEFILKPN